jgi:hypothetical protein
MPRKDYKATPEQIARWRAYDRAYYRTMKEKVPGWYQDVLDRKNRGHAVRMKDPAKRAAYAARKHRNYLQKKQTKT